MTPEDNAKLWRLHEKFVNESRIAGELGIKAEVRGNIELMAQHYATARGINSCALKLREAFPEVFEFQIGEEIK